MPEPRYRQVSIEATPYYHCISRCVRRAFLCGSDPLTGFNFAHRRQWIVDRIKQVCSVFAVDQCAYAIMSNHYHIVVKINPARVADWTDQEVAERWLQMFSGPLLMQQFLTGTDLSEFQLQRVAELLAIWRERLADLSWLMRCINEPIARMANSEDYCTGSFWEGRFKSQALLDDRALLACLAYVDLNPIRAAMATTPEQSDYTSIQERIECPQSNGLALFSEHGSEAIPFNLKDYLELVDWAGREVRRNKRGYIPASAPPILVRLNMNAAPVLHYLSKDDLPSTGALGPVSKLRSFAASVGRKFVKGHLLGARLCPQRA
jgi:REP element-mobilizing transposase RayT